MGFNKLHARALLFLLMSFCMQASSATDPTPFYGYTIKGIRFTPLITLTGGTTYAQVGQTQTKPQPLTLYETVENTYQANRHTRSRPMFGGFIGAEFLTPLQWLSCQLGFGYYQINSLDATGVLYQASNLSMDYDNFNYQYQIKSRQILLESKILFNWRQIVHPYVTLGAGLGINSAHGYIEEPRYTYSGPAHVPFSDGSTHTFTYALGLGADFDVWTHLRIGAGYRFANLGGYSLGTSPAVASGARLGESHIYANELLLQFTALV